LKSQKRRNKENDLAVIVIENYSNKWGTSHNRTVYAAPPVGGSGFRVARSFATLIPTPHSTHIFLRPIKKLRSSFFIGRKKKTS
jgi:hypothetical protein